MTAEQRHWFAMVCVTLLTFAPASLCAQSASDTGYDSTIVSDAIRVTGYAEGVLKHRGLSIHVFRGGAELRHRDALLKSQSLVLIRDSENHQDVVSVYAEGSETRHVQLIQNSGTRHSASRTLELQSSAGIESLAEHRETISRPDALIKRALAAIHPDQFSRTSQVSLQVNPELYIPPPTGNNSSSQLSDGTSTSSDQTSIQSAACSSK